MKRYSSTDVSSNFSIVLDCMNNKETVLVSTHNKFRCAIVHHDVFNDIRKIVEAYKLINEGCLTPEDEAMVDSVLDAIID